MSVISFCPLLASIPTTERQVLWTIIQDTLPWNLLVISAIALWVLFEYKTTIFWRSKNGRTPLFNKFVGSATYFGFQAIIPQVLAFIFDDSVYCALWPLATGVHLFMLWFTGYFLREITGFWVYKKDLTKKKWYLRRRR